MGSAARALRPTLQQIEKHPCPLKRTTVGPHTHHLRFCLLGAARLRTRHPSRSWCWVVPRERVSWLAVARRDAVSDKPYQQ